MEKKFSFEKEALLASGVDGKDEIAICENRLHLVLQQVLSEISQVPDPLIKARDLFNWLWSFVGFNFYSVIKQNAFPALY